MASGSGDKTVRLWNLSTPSAEPVILNGHQNVVESVAFSPDGKTLTSGSGDKTVFLWITTTQILSEKVCQKVWRNMSMDEWRRFVGVSIPYERTYPNLPVHPTFIEEGQNLAKNGDIERAVEIFKRVVELDPDLNIDLEAEAHKWEAQGANQQ